MCFYEEHLDLLHSYAMDAYQLRADSQMDGYVWDYSAYPACTTVPESDAENYNDPEDPSEEPPEPTEPPTEPTTEPTEPMEPTDPTEESTVPTEPPAETPTENESDGTP